MRMWVKLSWREKRVGLRNAKEFVVTEISEFQQHYSLQNSAKPHP
jgi:hypothetical protein